uniref:Ribonuclease H protein At1g65750 family n=1 Tax=Cajanus cajan TaxID=3821 RepID=A0A151TE96_CAJCA|nr:Putative ribonuclease H protein At1g65750 family [Cajanus cajan]
MGGGGVLRGGRGDWQFGFSTCYGQGSPFLAEILVIRDGLMHAWRLGYRNITCETDCMEAVNAINISDMRELSLHAHKNKLLQIHDILRKHWRVKIVYIHREWNKVADCLAHEGVNGLIKEFITPPSLTLEAFLQDLANVD